MKGRKKDATLCAFRFFSFLFLLFYCFFALVARLLNRSSSSNVGQRRKKTNDDVDVPSVGSFKMKKKKTRFVDDRTPSSRKENVE